MRIKLEDCKLITSLEYLDLVNPQFVGQTRANKEGDYHMVFLSEDVYYSIKHNLLNIEEYDECIDGEFSV